MIFAVLELLAKNFSTKFGHSVRIPMIGFSILQKSSLQNGYFLTIHESFLPPKFPAIRYYLLNHFCSAYTGRFCAEDLDGCTELLCFDGVECTDVRAPGIGAMCGTCPPGYTGDGLNCLGTYIPACIIILCSLLSCNFGITDHYESMMLFHHRYG